MTTTTRFTRDGLRDLAQDIDKALEEVAKKHEISIKVGNSRYSNLEATMKLELSTTNNSGESQHELDFRSLASRFGYEADWFGRTIHLSGTAFKVSGLNMKSPKNRINLVRVKDNKGFKCPVAVLRRAIEKDLPSPQATLTLGVK
tara:strand:- start:319 stop:753 length:435 start_codon:yes stop_codon:yes gene_type:complete